jgi:hypothetical protein
MKFDRAIHVAWANWNYRQRRCRDEYEAFPLAFNTSRAPLDGSELIREKEDDK